MASVKLNWVTWLCIVAFLVSACQFMFTLDRFHQSTAIQPRCDCICDLLKDTPAATHGGSEIQNFDTRRQRKTEVTNNQGDRDAIVHEIPYIHENAVACSRPLLYIIYVFTAPGNFKQRQDIRDTWGNSQLFTNPRGQVVFMLGTTEDEAVSARIQDEIRLHGDIVQANFVESYANVTLKGIMALRWLAANCRNVSYVIKIDDDIFLNIFGVLDAVEEFEQKKTPRSFYCAVQPDGTLVVRDKRSKYYMSRRVIADNAFPRYCVGHVWIMTCDLIHDLSRASWEVPFIQIEDVYTSGLLAKRVGKVKHHMAINDGEWGPPPVYENMNVPLPRAGPILRENYIKTWKVVLRRVEHKYGDKINKKALKV